MTTEQPARPDLLTRLDTYRRTRTARGATVEELGLIGEVRAGLARLHALGRLGWGAVGHLILYRLVEVRVQAEGVAA